MAAEKAADPKVAELGKMVTDHTDANTKFIGDYWQRPFG